MRLSDEQITLHLKWLKEGGHPRDMIDPDHYDSILRELQQLREVAAAADVYIKSFDDDRISAETHDGAMLQLEEALAKWRAL